MSKKTRIEYIDIVRSVGIVIMVMGHIGFTRYFDKWIHGWHMPLFFILSGYLYRDRSFGEEVKKKAATLLIPYFKYGLASLIIYFVFEENSIKAICSFLFVNTSEYMPISGALWFLTALFFTTLIFNIIVHIRKPFVRFLVAILISLFGVGIPLVFNVRLPWALDCSFVALLFLELGYEFNNSLMKDRIERIVSGPMWGGLLLVISTLSIFANGYFNMREAKYAFYPISVLNALMMTIGLLNIGYYMCKRKRNQMLERIKKEFLFISTNSIIYVCINQIVIWFLFKLELMVYKSNNMFITIVLHTIILILTLIIIKAYTRMISFIKNKIKMILITRDGGKIV